MELDRPLDEKVKDLQAELMKLPQYEPITDHYFHGGIYCRKVMQEAGVLVVGKVHKKDHMCLIASGRVRIVSDNDVTIIEAPYLLLSRPGTKRAIYAETDTVYMTFHALDEMSIEQAEDELVEQDPTSHFGVGNKLKTDLIDCEPKDGEGELCHL